jgi:hypothetical protein
MAAMTGPFCAVNLPILPAKKGAGVRGFLARFFPRGAAKTDHLVYVFRIPANKTAGRQQARIQNKH